MKDQFVIRFDERCVNGGNFWAATPINPSDKWLDFVEQCYILAASQGSGEYWVVSEEEPVRQLRFYI